MDYYTPSLPTWQPIFGSTGSSPPQLIPSDLKFDPNANPPCFSSDEDQATIEKGTRIRLKIVGTRVDATEIVSFSPHQFCL